MRHANMTRLAAATSAILLLACVVFAAIQN